MEVTVRWRDDRSNKWYNERQQTVDKKLDFLYFQTPGQYRTRQYEFTITDNAPLVLIAAEEEVEILDV